MKRKFLPLLLTVVLVVAAAVVPMLTLTASAEDGTWELVTDASTLAAGDQVVIVAKDSAVALSTTQNSNNRGQASVTKDGETVTFEDDVQILTLEAGTAANSFAFNTGSGYLYAASSSKNYLRTETTLSANSSWTIEIAADGTATVTAQGTNTRNLMQYNKSSSLFASYSGAQQAIVIYKLVVAGGSEGGDTPDTPTCEHANTTTTTTPATKTEDGSIVVTCVDCGYKVSEEKIPALGCNVDFVVPAGATAPSSQAGVLNATMPDAPALEGNYAQAYIFAGWAMVEIDEDTTERPTLYAVGEKVKLTDDTTFYAVYSYDVEGEGESTGGAYEFNSNITAGDRIVITMTTSDGTVFALSSSGGTSSAPGDKTVTIVNGKISGTPTDDILWDVAGNATDGYIFYVAGSTAKWLYCTSTNNGVRVGTNTANKFVVDEATNYLKHIGTSRYLGVYNKQDWRCYTNTTGNTANQTLGFYVLSSSNTVTYYVTDLETTACDHSNATVERNEPTCTENGSIVTTCDCGYTAVETIPSTGHDHSSEVTIAPTCTEPGVETYTCDNGCGDTYEKEIPATGHNYVDGECENCGIPQPDEMDYELSFATEANRTYQDGNKQVWEQNGIIFVNNKAASTNAVVASVNPVRLYQNSNIVITAPGYISKIVFNCNTTGYAEALVNSIDSNATADGKVVTVTLAGTDKTFSVAKLTAQVRVDSVTVTASKTPLNPTFSAASLTLGTDLAMNYFVTLPKNGVIDGYSVKFTFKGVETVVDTYTEVNGEYVFTLAGIGPQNYQDNIEAELLYNGETVYTKDTYSVEASLNGYVADEDTKALAEAALAYCAAAKAYVSDEITSTEKVEGTVAETGKSITNNEKVTAVGVNFDYVNRIYVKLNADATVTFNGVAAEVVDLGNGVYIAYSDALTALQFNNTVTIKVDDTTTVTYSVNAYAYTKQNAENVEMANLAITLYNYGVAAEAYKAAQSAN